jgi:hypothetical protein
MNMRAALLLISIALAQVSDEMSLTENGKRLFEEGRYDEAILAFKEAIRMNPDYSEAHSALGLVYYHEERYAEALEAFKRASEIEPENPDYRIQLAAAYERLGLIDEATEQLETYLSLTEKRGDKEESDEVGRMIEKMRGDEEEPSASLTSEDVENELFRFIVISDTHVGENFDGGTQDTEYLGWIMSSVVPAVRPEFMVLTGDITDSTNGGLIPLGGPYQKEWDQYADIISGSASDFLYDLPGNHDQYKDADLSYYLDNSVQGKANGYTQTSWFLDSGGKRFQFIGTCTAGNDGASWPSDNAGLDPDEISWIEQTIDAEADRVFFFGHHPLEDLEYGRAEMESFLRGHNATYIYGHTHEYGISYFEGKELINCDSLGKSSDNHYLLFRIGNDGVAVEPYTYPQVPI